MMLELSSEEALRLAALLALEEQSSDADPTLRVLCATLGARLRPCLPHEQEHPVPETLTTIRMLAHGLGYAQKKMDQSEEGEALRGRDLGVRAFAVSGAFTADEEVRQLIKDQYQSGYQMELGHLEPSHDLGPDILGQDSSAEEEKTGS